MTKDDVTALLTKLHRHWCRDGDACSSASAPRACPALTGFGFRRAPYLSGFLEAPPTEVRAAPYVDGGDGDGVVCYAVAELLTWFPQSPESSRRPEELEPPQWWVAELIEEVADALEILTEMAPSRVRALVLEPTREPETWVVQTLMPRN